MHIPDSFTENLNATFQHRLRLRWSPRLQEFHLEQKVRRGLADVSHLPNVDERARAKDGYMYVMSIKANPRMGCPRCGSALDAPIRVIAEVTCDFCKLMGREHKVVAGYFPLDDRLIDYLKQLDPTSDHSRARKTAMDRHNERLMASQQRQAVDAALDAANDDFSHIAGIPMVGYTGKDSRS